ncbi:phosphoglycerate mutase-like protein [Clavulina sp. PMI_390]|nr:phosphoglycerate mutase-like protein [Clavulina sp. PMI_390]
MASASSSSSNQAPLSVEYTSKATKLEPDLYPTPPKGLELAQVNVFVRHGERTPVGIRMTEPPASLPSSWTFCGEARRFKAAVVGAQNALEELEVHRIVERGDGTSKDEECMLGELTNVGRQSTYQYGRALRDLYVSKLGFLPSTFSDQDAAYFRSTNMPRTVETLQEVLHGLYPTEHTAPGLVPKVRVRQPQDENLMGNSYICARLKELMIGFEKAAIEKYNPRLAAFNAELSPYINGNPVQIDGKPRASGILDTIRAAKSHGVPVPAVFEDTSIMLPLEEAIVAEWFDGYKHPEVRKLAMGRLLSDISTRMQKKAEKGDKDPLKIAIHACHDTSLAGMQQTLDVFDGRWPEFTASMTVELFKDTASSGSSITSFLGLRKPAHYVRFRYQNRTLKLPMCADPKDHYPGSPEMCTLEAFSRRAAELTPKDWMSECKPQQGLKRTNDL